MRDNIKTNRKEYYETIDYGANSFDVRIHGVC